MPTKILAVDDDPEITGALHRLLASHGFEVKEENDSSHAIQAAREFQPEFIILDYQMPGLHGGDVAWELANDSSVSAAKIIFCSGLSEKELQGRLPTTRIPVLGKPVDTERLLQLLEECRGLEAQEFRRPATRPR